MKKATLLLAVILILVAWTPVSAAKGSVGEKNMSSMIEDCPFYPCANFVSECENPGGTILWLDPVTECNFFNDTFTLYEGMCQFPPATFWDEVCFG
ncbi:MAG TPA: hypothetical protein VF179_19355 [Thermoanaerobaculia bacterium]|nr:hypothetical protein [Thermoanaerobaculia bacterium]